MTTVDGVAGGHLVDRRKRCHETSHNAPVCPWDKECPIPRCSDEAVRLTLLPARRL